MQVEPVQAAACFTIPADHPSLAGHFPGHPVVPGVVLLDHLLARLGLPGAVHLSWVKFVAPVPPDRTVAVTWSSGPAGRADFSARIDGHEVLRGRAIAAGERR